MAGTDETMIVKNIAGSNINDSATHNGKRSYTEADKHDLVNRERFNQQLSEYYRRKVNKKPFTRHTLRELKEELLIAKGKRFRKDRREYHILRTYDTAIIEGKEHVIRKSDQIPIIAFEDLYDTIFNFHNVITNHGGKTKLEAAYKRGKVNIPRAATEIFLLCCKECCARKNVVEVPREKPKYIKGFSHKGQIDIIDLHSISNESYTVVLSYQDHYTKFLVLRPLENDAPDTIAEELLNVFMLIGAPKILESYNGKYFVTKILENLNGIWSESITAYGEPKDSGCPSKTPDEIENSIRSWMQTNSTTNWISGLNIIQWQANSSINKRIGRYPYQALFGFTPRLHLLSPVSTCSFRNNGKGKTASY